MLFSLPNSILISKSFSSTVLLRRENDSLPFCFSMFKSIVKLFSRSFTSFDLRSSKISRDSRSLEICSWSFMSDSLNCYLGVTLNFNSSVAFILVTLSSRFEILNMFMSLRESFSCSMPI